MSALDNSRRAAPRRSGPRWTLVCCILASSLSFVDGSVLSIALPAICAGYGAGAEQVQWVVNAYLLPLSALLLLGGALGDHFGRRRLLVIGTGLFSVASLTCALAPSLALLLAARAAQELGRRCCSRTASRSSMSLTPTKSADARLGFGPPQVLRLPQRRR